MGLVKIAHKDLSEENPLYSSQAQVGSSARRSPMGARAHEPQCGIARACVTNITIEKDKACDLYH